MRAGRPHIRLPINPVSAVVSIRYVDEDGAEQTYVTTVDRPVANFGVSVVAASEAISLALGAGSLAQNDAARPAHGGHR